MVPEQRSAGSDEPDNRRHMDWNNVDPIHVTHISTLSELSSTVLQFSRKVFPRSYIPRKDHLIVSQTPKQKSQCYSLNRPTEPMDIPINECRGAFQATQGLGIQERHFNLFLRALIPSSIQNVFLKNVSLYQNCTSCTHTSPGKLCHDHHLQQQQTKTNQETAIVNIDGDETKSPRLAGSLPELGGWNPTEGVTTTRTGEQWSTKVTLPAHKVSAFKVVYQTDNGFQWKDGGNRFLHSDTDRPFGYDKF